jgi:hypothetical protein
LRHQSAERAVRDEFDEIETDNRSFAKVEIDAATIELDGFDLPF